MKPLFSIKCNDTYGYMSLRRYSMVRTVEQFAPSRNQLTFDFCLSDVLQTFSESAVRFFVHDILRSTQVEVVDYNEETKTFFQDFFDVSDGFARFYDMGSCGDTYTGYKDANSIVIPTI